MLKSDPRYFAEFFLVLFILGVPIVFAVTMASTAPSRAGGILTAALLLAFDLGQFLFVRHYNALPDLSFRQGLRVVCVSMSSGCANLTILYVFPLLGVVYAIASVNAVLGLIFGKASAQERWKKLILWFDSHTLRKGL